MPSLLLCGLLGRPYNRLHYLSVDRPQQLAQLATRLIAPA
jgi:hypothetical protein